MAYRRAYVGTYVDPITHVKAKVRRATTQDRVYTHAVIPYLGTGSMGPNYGEAQFCTSLALAQKKLKPGWLLIEVREEQR